MAAPVLKLFPACSYSQFEQVRLGRKTIDLVFIRHYAPLSVSVELKVANWKKALWQAAVNYQVCDESYIAIWHTFAHRAMNNAELLAAYGVGLIVVAPASAQVQLRAQTPRRIPSNARAAWYRQLLGTEGGSA